MKRALVLLFVTLVAAASYGRAEEDICRLPAVTGLCLAYLPRWYYNFEKRACETFINGGCTSNKNSFLTKCECQNRCGGDNIDICCQPAVAGPCQDSTPRWFYNSKSAACEQFTYGGCQGNQNNFENKSQCEQKCLEN